MKFRHPKLLLAGLAALGAVVIASYFLFFQKNTNTIHVALVTSDRKEVRDTSQRSIRMCIDTINQNGGVNGNQIVLDVFNDRGNPDIAEDVALEIVQQNRAIAVIGHHYSDCAIRAGEIYKKYGIPAITPWATNVKVTKDNPWYFRTVFNDKLQGQFLATYARKVLKQDTVSIIHDNREYGTYLAGVFEDVSKSLGTEIKYKWTFRADDKDLDRTLRSIVYALGYKSDAGAVFIATYPEEGVRLVRLIKDTLIQNPLMLSDALASTSFSHGFSEYPKEKRNPGYYTNGIYVTTPFLFDTGNSEAQRFRDKYHRAHQEEPGWHSAYAYDTIRLLGEVMARAGVSGDADAILEERKTLRDHLAKLTRAEDAVAGLTGLNYFDKNGDSPKPISIGVYTNRSIISALTQLRPVGNVYDIPDLKQARADDQVLIFGGRFMYKTKVIYTGVKLNEISEIDMKKMTCLLDFHLWFRYEGDADARSIEFLNTAEKISLGDPLDIQVKDQFTSKLYHVRGTFKTDFITSRDDFGGHLAGFSFRHRDLTQNNLLYVKDVLGMGMIHEDGLDEMRQNNVLPVQSGWTIVRPFFSHDVSRKSALGKLDYLKYQRKADEYSQFSFGVRIRSSAFTLRRKLTQEWAVYLLLLSVGTQLALTAALRMVHTPISHFSKPIWLLRTIFALLTLLTAEEVALNLLLQKTDIGMAHLNLVVLAFDILWWLIPAFLVNLSLKPLIWEPMEARSGQPVPNVLRRFFAYIIFFLAFYGIVAFVFDQSLTKLMATSGVVAMAIGFVVKANISNFFSGIVIHQGSAIRTGDWVKIGDYEDGKVVDITWRSTKLRARDGSLLSIPNSTVSDAIVHNYNFPDDLYKISLNVDVDAIHPPVQVRKILRDAVISAERVLKSPEPSIRFTAFSRSAAHYSVEFFIRDYGRKDAYKEAVWERIWMHLNFSAIFREVPDAEDQDVLIRRRNEVPPLMLLSEMDIFQPFSHEAKVRLSREMRRHRFPPGEVIVEQGDTGNSLFIIAEGVVGVWIRMEGDTAPFEVVRMGAGNFFGEMALLTGEPRFATIISVTDTSLFEITKEDIFPFIEEQPEIFRSLSKVLTERKFMTESQLDLSLKQMAHKDRNALSTNLLDRIQTFFGKDKKQKHL